MKLRTVFYIKNVVGSSLTNHLNSNSVHCPFCFVYNCIPQQVEKRERDNESDDVESNLLLPAGIALRWVTFLLKIYRAEDIPQSMWLLPTSPLVFDYR